MNTIFASSCPHYNIGKCIGVKCKYKLHIKCNDNYHCIDKTCYRGHGISITKRQIINNISKLYYNHDFDESNNQCYYSMKCFYYNCNKVHPFNAKIRNIVLEILKSNTDLNAIKIYELNFNKEENRQTSFETSYERNLKQSFETSCEKSLESSCDEKSCTKTSYANSCVKTSCEKSLESSCDEKSCAKTSYENSCVKTSCEKSLKTSCEKSLESSCDEKSLKASCDGKSYEINILDINTSLDIDTGIYNPSDLNENYYLIEDQLISLIDNDKYIEEYENDILYYNIKYMNIDNMIRDLMNEKITNMNNIVSIRAKLSKL